MIDRRIASLALLSLLSCAAACGGGTKGSGITAGDTSTDSDLTILAPFASGVVTNAERIPIPGAIVTNDDTGVQVTTDSSGAYQLPITAPSVCASVGFGDRSEGRCVDAVSDPNLSSELVIDFILDVPTGQLPPAAPVEPPSADDEQPRACGGLLGLQCVAGEYCSFAPDAICGAADATGICKGIPEVCPEIFAPVCGCDGKTYESSCVAAGNGVSAATDGPCPEDLS